MKRELILLWATLITASATCLAQTSPSPAWERVPNAGMIADLEESAWQAYQNKQTRSFKKLFYKTYYGVYADGIKTLDMQLADMEKTELRDYSFRDINVEFPNANLAIITYKATQEATYDGQDVSGTYYCESVWVKKGQKWLNALHTEIKSK
jgi:hypothetical protein